MVSVDIGSTLGPYRLVAELGQGGMARLFLGLRPMPDGTQREAAIKVIRPEHLQDRAFVEMFLGAIVQDAQAVLAAKTSVADGLEAAKNGRFSHTSRRCNFTKHWQSDRVDPACACPWATWGGLCLSVGLPLSLLRVFGG